MDNSLTVNVDYDRPTVIWQKWYNPFSSEEVKEIVKKMRQQHQVENDEDVEPDDIDMPEPIRVFWHPIVGIIPVTDYSEPDKIFNFWLGHTNFNISKKIAKMIKEVDGVEIFDPVTRYRFRIGIAQAFKDGTVIGNISKKIQDFKADFINLRQIIEDSKAEPEKIPENPPEEEAEGV